jgi:4-diphosphocytidyl-2-C-methyl-D-erythritol kinase
MRLLSPAKINLHLRVAPPGADGFHPIMSWFCTTGFADTLIIEASEGPGIKISCNRADVPLDGSNLIARAAEAMLAQMPERRGAAIHLQKEVPIGGGMGGGSSNCAFALMGLNRVWDLNWPTDRLVNIGSKLGSDVPFFFYGASCVCEGRGEKVTPIGRPGPGWVVLIFPKLSMPTPAVYRKFDELKLGSVAGIEHQPDWKRWTGLSAKNLLPLLVNDLEAPAFAINAELGAMRDRLEKWVGRIVRMSGSGSTLFTLVDDKEEAERLAEQVCGAGIDAAAARLSPEQ